MLAHERAQYLRLSSQLQFETFQYATLKMFQAQFEATVNRIPTSVVFLVVADTLGFLGEVSGVSIPYTMARHPTTRWKCQVRTLGFYNALNTTCKERRFLGGG